MPVISSSSEPIIAQEVIPFNANNVVVDTLTFGCKIRFNTYPPFKGDVFVYRTYPLLRIPIASVKYFN